MVLKVTRWSSDMIIYRWILSVAYPFSLCLPSRNNSTFLAPIHSIVAYDHGYQRLLSFLTKSNMLHWWPWFYFWSSVFAAHRQRIVSILVRVRWRDIRSPYSPIFKVIERQAYCWGGLLSSFQYEFQKFNISTTSSPSSSLEPFLATILSICKTQQRSRRIRLRWKHCPTIMQLLQYPNSI
jgi:hypothetical protein